MASSKKPIVIAVLDTGFGFNNEGHVAHLCKYGHKDFTKDRQLTKDYGTVDAVPHDNQGHGTNIVGLIQQFAKSEVGYCFVIIKYYSQFQSDHENQVSSVLAFKKAYEMKVNIINYSGGGPNQNQQERKWIGKFLTRGGVLFAAAGNDHLDLDVVGNEFYPAMYYNKVIAVGNKSADGQISKSSNYGNAVKWWEVGERQTAFGVTMSGTSQATAVATGKRVSEMLTEKTHGKFRN